MFYRNPSTAPSTGRLTRTNINISGCLQFWYILSGFASLGIYTKPLEGMEQVIWRHEGNTNGQWAFGQTAITDRKSIDVSVENIYIIRNINSAYAWFSLANNRKS